MAEERLKEFINAHRSLFWYTPEAEKENISPGLLVETILNYGTMDDVRSLFHIMGIEKVADIFYSAKGRQKLNYYPEIYNFFDLVFKRYVPRRS
ncbi:MAG: hypothetical protein LIP03_05875 [Bacteroidales bacterium]|nr:hypothetical protein [Bacteroidales bacterium]